MKTESAGALYKGNLGYDDVGFFSGIQDFFLVFYRSMESCDAFWAWSVIFIVGPKTYTGYLSKNIQMIKFNMEEQILMNLKICSPWQRGMGPFHLIFGIYIGFHIIYVFPE